MPRCPSRKAARNASHFVIDLRAGMGRPRPPRVPRIGEAPAHADHATTPRPDIPHDDGQRAVDAIGDDLVAPTAVTAIIIWSVAATAVGERLREHDHFAPRGLRRELAAHRLGDWSGALSRENRMQFVMCPRLPNRRR